MRCKPTSYRQEIRGNDGCGRFSSSDCEVMKQQHEPQVLLYQTDDGTTRVEVRMEGETVWLNQNQMAELFLTTKQNVGQHIRNVFAEGELAPEPVVKDFFTTAADGKQYRTKHYNLDEIISVGYRVKSHRGTQSRVVTRVRQGGHDVPEAVVRRRFAAGITHFHARYKPLVDFWQLYGNASTPPVLIAEGGLP